MRMIAARSRASPEERVSDVAVTLGVAVVAAGVVASLVDARLGLFAVAVAIGWTQLVGL